MFEEFGERQLKDTFRYDAEGSRQIKSLFLYIYIYIYIYIGCCVDGWENINFIYLFLNKSVWLKMVIV